MRISTSLILAALFAGSACADTILYDNLNPPSVDTFTGLTFNSGPFDGIGDSVTVTAPGVVSDALIQLFNDGAAGTFDASFLLFTAGSPVGIQIGSTYTQTGITAGANSYVNLDFANLGLAVPGNVVLMLELANVTAGVDLGLELYSGTAAGSNTADTAIVLQGSSFSQVSTGGDGSGNPAFQLTSVPEPSTLLPILGFAALLLNWRRTSRRNQSPTSAPVL